MGPSIMKPKFCITGARIAPLGRVEDVLEGHDLWIADGKIAATSPAGAPAPFDGPYETCVFKDFLILPGLVNSHSHSASALLRGTAPGAPLDLYVMEAMSRRSRRTMRQVRVSVLLHAIEMLKHGVTGVVDHFRSGAVPSVETVSTVFQAYDDVGMRAAVAPMFEDKRYIDSLPIDQQRLPPEIQDRWRDMKPPMAEDYFAMMEEVAATWRGHERLHLMLGVDGATALHHEIAGDGRRLRSASRRWLAHASAGSKNAGPDGASPVRWQLRRLPSPFRPHRPKELACAFRMVHGSRYRARGRDPR
jgi:cytosine/adenosine deaminase-related metal-dependent hydrolase